MTKVGVVCASVLAGRCLVAWEVVRVNWPSGRPRAYVRVFHHFYSWRRLLLWLLPGIVSWLVAAPRVPLFMRWRWSCKHWPAAVGFGSYVVHGTHRRVALN